MFLLFLLFIVLFFDLRQRIIPNELIFIIGIMALPKMNIGGLFAALILGGVLFLLRAIAAGDYKLLIALGLHLTGAEAIVVIILSLLAGAVTGLSWLNKKKGKLPFTLPIFIAFISFLLL